MYRASSIAHHAATRQKCLCPHQVVRIFRSLSTVPLQTVSGSSNITVQSHQLSQLSTYTSSSGLSSSSIARHAASRSTKHGGGVAQEDLLSWDVALQPEDQCDTQKSLPEHDPPSSSSITLKHENMNSSPEDSHPAISESGAPVDHFTLVNFIQAVNTKSPAQAWIALQEIATHHPLGLSVVHSRWLHKFNALLVSSDAPYHPRHQAADLSETPPLPKSRAILPPLRASIQELRRRQPSSVRTWEWNALIAQTAGGHRHVSLGDYRAAADVLEQWLSDIRQSQEQELIEGSQLDSRQSYHFVAYPNSTTSTHPLIARLPLPNIVTYNTLLNIAAHVYSPFAFQDAQRRYKAARLGKHLDTAAVPAPNLQPDRRTYLAALVYYAKQAARPSDDLTRDEVMDLDGIDDELTRAFSGRDVVYRVPQLLSHMIKRGLYVGVDGINAALWVFARAGRSDIVYGVYRALRANGELQHASPQSKGSRKASIQRSNDSSQKPETVVLDLLTQGRTSHSPPRLPDRLGSPWPSRESQPGDSYLDNPKSNPILGLPGMAEIVANLKPDGVTYATVIQSLAYHGQLVPALQVFRDLLIAIREASAESAQEDKSPESSENSLGSGRRITRSTKNTFSLEAQTLVAYRAIFLGFIHHGAGSPSDVHFGPAESMHASMSRKDPEPTSPSPWTLDSLLSIFHSYISLPFTELPSTRFIRTLLIAFQRTAQRGGTITLDKSQHHATTSQPLHQAPDYQMMMEYVYGRLVRDRFEKSREWKDAKDSQEWTRLRRDFVGEC